MYTSCVQFGRLDSDSDWIWGRGILNHTNDTVSACCHLDSSSCVLSSFIHLACPSNKFYLFPYVGNIYVQVHTHSYFFPNIMLMLTVQHNVSLVTVHFN